MTWGDELTKTESGSIDKTILVPNPDKFLGLSFIQARILFPSLTFIFLPLFFWILIITIKPSPTMLSKKEIMELQVRNKHKAVILEVNELPKPEARQPSCRNRPLQAGNVSPEQGDRPGSERELPWRTLPGTRGTRRSRTGAPQRWGQGTPLHRESDLQAGKGSDSPVEQIPSGLLRHIRDHQRGL